jgi:probable F420-dependent oxidoreductase
MQIGMHLRNMGPQSTRETLTDCARSAERAGVDDLWVNDHIAIPKDASEGSGGRYVDPLAALAYIAGTTERIGLGTAVLILPYRAPLITAKWIASIQELSGGRLRLGAGVGWMDAEFRAAGVQRTRRGEITDETLKVLHQCFAEDEVELNGQRFLFLPRPERPPIFIGGAPPHVISRIVRYGDGWMPTVSDVETLGPTIADLNTQMSAAGKPAAQVIPLTSLPLDDPARAEAKLQSMHKMGITGVIHSHRYADAEEFSRTADQLVELREQFNRSN